MIFSAKVLKRIALVSTIVLFCVAGAYADETPASKDNKSGIFVAVGYGGRRMSSHDGVTWQNVQQWTDKAADDSNNLISVAYGKGKFVAVGGGGWSRETQAGHVLVSTDGATWREVKKLPFRISPVLFEGGRFVAGAPDHQVIWSDDGENWNEGAKFDAPKNIPAWAFWFRRGVAGNGIFVFTGNADKGQKIWWCLTTRDGQSVASFATDLSQVKSLAFGAGKFLIVSGDGIHSSTDGKSWQHEAASPADELSHVIWTGREFLVQGKKASYTSADGVAWKQFGAERIPGSIVWSDGKRFIATGWPGKIWTSADAKTWTQDEQVVPTLAINQITYGTPTK